MANQEKIKKGRFPKKDKSKKLPRKLKKKLFGTVDRPKKAAEKKKA
jgi:hypothetical protein